MASADRCAPPLGRVAFMTGHDDDVVLDPRVASELGRAAEKRSSRWRGMQSDLAIVDAVRTGFPQLQVETLQTVEELLATEADVVVIISYKTQLSFAWYASFFDALHTLESRGTTVYPSAAFKETISSKARYMKLLQAGGLPMCPTAFLERADCVGEDGTTLVPSLVESHLSAALRSLGLLRPPPPALAAHADTAGSSSSRAPRRDDSSTRPGFHLVTKPSNADGGFGVAFWEAPTSRPQAIATAAGAEPGSEPSEGAAPAVGAANGLDGVASDAAGVVAEAAAARATAECAAHNGRSHAASSGASASENADVQTRSAPLGGDSGAASAAASAAECCLRTSAVAPAAKAALLNALELRTMLTAGNDAPEPDAGGCAFLHYLRQVGFVGKRPHVLLQPLVPALAQNFEIKIYFLCRKPLYASMVYGKEKLMAKVVRPATDPALFAYLEPLIGESLRALDLLPPDGPHDPKILMRVDWCTGEPLLPEAADTANQDGEREEADADTAAAAEASVGDKRAAGESGFLKRALVKRAGSLAAPQKKLKKSIEMHARAPLAGPGRHFINEIEIHPGYYVDWDATPDDTLEPLGRAYGEYLVRLLTDKRAEGAR